MLQSSRIFDKAGDRLPPASRINRKGRIHLMDEIRGLCVLLMIFTTPFTPCPCFSISGLGQSFWCFSLLPSPFFAGLFILISGISSQLSHSNLVRGLKLLGVAVALTLVTYFIIPMN